MTQAPEDMSAHRWALAGLSLAMLMPSLDTSIANVGLPAMAQTFRASFHDMQWVVLAYLLAITSLIVGVGRLGDIVGRRRLLLGGIALFTAASVLCGLAPNLPFLVAARAAQGLGAAAMMALAVGMVGETVPKSRIGAAMGLLGAMSAIGTTLGPSLGGLLIAGFGWPSIFLVNLPLGLATLLLAIRTLPADRPRAGRAERFDIAGALLLALTLTAYALAMTTGGNAGPVNLGLLSFAGAGGVAFLAVQARIASPLVQLATLREPGLVSGLCMTLLVSTVMMTTLVVGPFFLARGLGLAPALVGLTMSAGPLLAALAGVPAGRVVDRFGSGGMIIAGLAGMGAGLVALALAPSRFGVAGYVAAIGVVTVHYALFQAANGAAVMRDLPPDRRGVVAGLLSLSRNLGLITGASVMGAVFAFAAGSADVMSAAPGAVAGGMRVTFVLAAALTALAAAIAIAGAALRGLPGSGFASVLAKASSRTVPPRRR